MGTLTRGFSNMGLSNSKDDIAANYTKAVKEKYVFMTWRVSYDFAKLLIDDLIKGVQVTKGDIDSTITQFQTAQEVLYGAICSRCMVESEEKQSQKGVVIKHYDPNKVQFIMKGAITNERDNKERIRLMTASLLGILNPEKKNFREVAEKLKAGIIIGKLEEQGQEQANNFFANEVGNDYIPGYEKLIGVNIIQKLQEEFSGNPDGLKEKLYRLVRHAAITNTHRGVEVNNGPEIRSSMFVILPDYDQDTTFLQEVEDTIKSLTKEGKIKVSRGGNSNEIVVINLETNLTPRYLEAVHTLKDSYDRLMTSQQGKVARFETQLEDYKGFIPMNVEECIQLDMLPSLYKPTDSEMKEIKAKREEVNGAETTKLTQKTISDNTGTPQPPPSMSHYYIYDNGKQSGPFPIPQILQMVTLGQVTKQTYVWKNGMAGWEQAGKVPELDVLFNSNTPPPPPPPMM